MTPSHLHSHTDLGLNPNLGIHQLSFSEPQFPYLQCGSSNSCLAGTLRASEGSPPALTTGEGALVSVPTCRTPQETVTSFWGYPARGHVKWSKMGMNAGVQNWGGSGSGRRKTAGFRVKRSLGRSPEGRAAQHCGGPTARSWLRPGRERQFRALRNLQSG